MTGEHIVGFSDALRLGLIADHLQPEVAHWQGAGIDAVVWDRAPAHQTLSGRRQSVAPILQPPHSPELNPAERVIEAIRQRIEGLVYPLLPDKYAAVTAFLAELGADPARVRSLTWYRLKYDAHRRHW